MLVSIACAVAATFAWSGSALADAKAKFAADCADCHEVKDYAGKPAAVLESKIKDIAAGKVKHKGKIKVTDAEAKELAAYLSAAK
jgi:mono/diheme cytochrome c family protein